MREIIIIMMSVILVDNFVLSKFLGACPFLGVSKKIESSLAMGIAVTFIMTLATAFTWPIYKYLLVTYDIKYLQTIVFILVIATAVQMLEMIIRKH